MPRVGITSPIRVQVGPLDIHYRSEVVACLEDAQFIFGNDMIQRIGLDYFGLPFRRPDQVGADDTRPIDRPIPLIAPDFTEEEASSEFQDYREFVLQAIQPELAANAAIPCTDFCPIPEAEVHLITEPGKVTFRRQYPLPYAQRAAINAKLKEWLEDGVIEVITTPSTFNTPFFLIPKKDSTGAKTDFRVCLDFRPLNQLLPDDSSPIPLINDIFEAVNGAQVFSTLDLRQAYHRFPVAVNDRYKTAFTWDYTQYQFRGAPFGLKMLPSQFQRVMSVLLHDLDFVRVFIDDLVVFSKCRSDHATHLAEVIRRLNQSNLILNVSKCHFARLEINLLGFRINPYGRSIDPPRLVNLADWPVPTTAKQLQSFLGFVNYFREYVPLISTITAPLNAIRGRDSISGQWTSECARAFQLLKDLLPQCPPLAQPDFSLPFCVATDASAVGIGAVLYQLDPQTSAPRYISFQARTLSSSERNYSATKRELLAVVFALSRFHHFIYGRRFTLYTDHHALVHLHTQPHLNIMMQSWYEQLFEYDFAVWHRPGILNILPDRLSRLFPPSELEGGSGSMKPAVDKFTPKRPAQPDNMTIKKASTPDQDRSYTEPPPDKRADIILQHHLRGHFGANATIDSIRETGLNWPNLTVQVKEACATCLPCQRHNIAKRGYHPLSPISADQPFDHVAIDLAGPFPTSPRGNHYLFVLIDIHSRFVCLRAIPDKRMATIGSTLFDVFTTFGFPKIVQSDNGTEFVNAVLKQLFFGAKIDHRLITPYHPRANGIAERTVQTAVSTIKKLLDGVQKEWDMSVPFTQFAMNTKVAAIHKSTPFSVLFGRSMNQFADFSSIAETPSMPVDVQARIQFMQESLFPGIAKLDRSAQDAMKSSFDATHKQADIPDGSYVMVRETARRKKLDPRFEGPFKVIGKSGSAYTLQDNSGALLPRNYPPSALKLISSDPVLDSESYVVDTILNHRETTHGYEYLVRWKNYSKDHDSWEPSASFDDEVTITNYWNRRQEAPTATLTDMSSAGRE
jgi:transposase InsO family protein